MDFERAVEDWKAHDQWEFADKEAAWGFFFMSGRESKQRENEMDPHIDGVVPVPMTDAERGFMNGMLIGNLRRIYAAHDDEGNDLSALPSRAADEIEKLLDRLTKDGDAYWKAREHLINRIEELAQRNAVLGSYRADEYEEAMQELDRHGIPRADGPGDNGLTLSLKGRMLRFLVRMTSNAGGNAT